MAPPEDGQSWLLRMVSPQDRSEATPPSPPRAREREFRPPTGKGTKIADIPNIITQLEKCKHTDIHIKNLHIIFFGRQGKASLRKQHISEFCGWDIKDDGKWVDGILATRQKSLMKHRSRIEKLNLPVIKLVAKCLDVDTAGVSTKGALVDLIAEFCTAPSLDLCSGKMLDMSATSANKKARQSKQKKQKSQRPRFPSAYVLFCKERGPAIRAANADSKPTEIMGIIATEWKQVAEEVKNKYAEQAREFKEQYINAHPEKKAKKRKRRTKKSRAAKKQKRAPTTPTRKRKDPDEPTGASEQGSESESVDTRDADQVDIGLEAVIGENFCLKWFGQKKRRRRRRKPAQPKTETEVVTEQIAIKDAE